MTGCTPKWRLILLLLLSFQFAGCNQLRRGSLDEEKEPHFMEGKKRFLRADWDGAIQSYERALQVNPTSSAAHLELGVLYDSKKNDYAAAIYHYQRHLSLRTNSPMANVVQEYVKACTRELAKTVQYAVVTREVQRDLERYSETNSYLKKRVEILEAELARRPQYMTNFVTNFVAVPQPDTRGSARLTQPTQPIPSPHLAEEKSIPDAGSNARRTSAKPPVQKSTAPPTRRETPSVARSPEPAAATGRTTHTVRPGETLASLAGRYGVSLQALRAANPGAANGVHSGQRISIPK